MKSVTCYVQIAIVNYMKTRKRRLMEMSTQQSKAVAGTMVKPRKGWEKRVEKLCDPEYWFVELSLRTDVADKLSKEEWDRLEKKLHMVQRFAAYMAAGMLKGTLKYSNDDYSLETWFAHLIGEGADQANYQILLENAFREKKK